MRYIRPFDTSAATSTGTWLVSPQEEAGCSVALRRGGGQLRETIEPQADRCALVLEGKVSLESHGEKMVAQVGELIFIPAGVSGAIDGPEEAVWADIIADLPQNKRAQDRQTQDIGARVVQVDPSKFTTDGFAYQSLIDRSDGAQALRMNVLQVQPGSGSPDWHIHAFSQLYLIQEGEMTVDIGRQRAVAAANTLVYFPAGVVHRNFNASNGVERHVTLLVPEPEEGAVFDFAVSISEHEADFLKQLPGPIGAATPLEAA